jgi:malonyl-CoA O-methyltransferase
MHELKQFQLDKRRVRLSFERAAQTYDKTAVLQKHIADELINRLDIIKIRPTTIIDVGCGTGYALRRLQKCYPKAAVIGLDIAPTMLRRGRRRLRWFRSQPLIAGDAEHCPLKDRSIDMIFCNVTLQWCDLDIALAEFSRVLKPGGLLMFSTFGPDTLKEIRHAWRQVDDDIHVHTFIDMHDIGDAMNRNQFQTPVVDVDHAVLTYANLDALLLDLKAIGASNAAAQRFRGLIGKSRFGRFRRAMESNREPQGRLQCSYEIIYGHAWGPTHRSSRDREGAISIPVTEIGKG